ncbi:MAG: response regulator [Desulfotomaculum sp.]|nr:response regulator [Desulfotomaculum sp.]
MKTVKVYIVEDDPMVADINKRMTEKVYPFKVIGTSSEETHALEQIYKLKPDLILLDIYLPSGSGIHLLQTIREQELTCDVVLITAAKDTGTIYKTMRYGAIDYIIKPFNLERLEKSLKNYLKLRTILDNGEELSQEDIDRLNGNTAFSNNNHDSNKQENLPKGVHSLTLNHIIGFLLKQEQPLSCQQIADALSMSKITVWRYLEYLAENNKVSMELDYGAVGRPSKKYFIAK